MRFQTAPTGPGEDIELPIYFLKLHQTAPTGPGEDIELPIYFLKLHEIWNRDSEITSTKRGQVAKFPPIGNKHLFLFQPIVTYLP